ncbi:MAG: ABC transporter substrate-binding protein, partial [Planctomycetota bacterium]
EQQGRVLAGRRVQLNGGAIVERGVALAHLWAEADLDPTQAATWPELAELCQRYTAFHDRPAIELNPTSSEHATLLLQQARPDAEAAASGPMLEHDALDDVLLFLANLLATDVAAPATRGHARWARDFAAGDLGLLWMPDWRVAYLRAAAPELAGNVGLMPLPQWSNAGPRTAGWGGTMLAIPANTSDPDAAVELLAFLAAGEPVVEARLSGTDIVPAIGDDTLDVEADDYFASGPPRRLYADLAAHVDLPRPTADYLAAAGHVGVILSSTTADLRAELPETEVLERLQNRLAAAQADVSRRRRMPRRGRRRR